MLSPWLKLATGVAATALISTAAWRSDAHKIVAKLSRSAAGVMLTHGIADGAVTFKSAQGWVFRTARLSGTADPATRAAVSAELARKPGIHAVEWRAR